MTAGMCVCVDGWIYVNDYMADHVAYNLEYRYFKSALSWRRCRRHRHLETPLPSTSDC